MGKYSDYRQIQRDELPPELPVADTFVETCLPFCRGNGGQEGLPQADAGDPAPWLLPAGAAGD